MTSDSAQRHRAVEETDRSFIVEASAGTGKTSTLLERILHLVLFKGPAGEPLRISRICAITFTEKAAGEMKIRLRRQFEKISSAGSGEPLPRVERAREALRDLESASISTFHSFAVSVLKERPIEAGLDPRFTALDEVRSELFFREIWEPWIGRALAGRRPALEAALKGGIALDALQDLARTLRLNAHAVRALSCDSPPDNDRVEEQIGEMLRQGTGFLAFALKSGDKLLERLETAVEWLRNPGSDAPKPLKPGNAGSAANWKEGKKTVERVQSYVRDVAGFCEACAMLPMQRLLHDTIQWIRTDFMTEWESRKRAAGFLDFDDQLWLARELLLKNRGVRAEFQARYAALLVDEFQDTDSIQWDIVRLLSSTDPEEPDPALLRPGPGRLFIVGDPKQSIYRFRSADIETYLEIAEARKMRELGLERLQLTTNFRSTPPILRFVDAAFEDAMKAPADGCYQPDYLPFGGSGDRAAEKNVSTVHLLGDRDNEGGSEATVREFLEREAARAASLISLIRGSAEWKVQDAGAATSKGGGWRPPRYGDIAVLLPVLSRADILEEALRENEIPYVLEGGKFYYARSEVSSAITLLRALANPNDQVALYGGLRSIFFGLSDEDLLRARMRGERLDYRAQVSEDSPLRHPFEVLRDLHQKRQERPASETFEALLQRTGAREVLAAHGFQSLANLNKLARTLRSLQGDATFSQVADLLSTMDEEGLAESESRLMEERSDAVRILSIHRAKGLDFPIVIVAALGIKKISRNRNLLADFHRRKVFGLSVGPRESGLKTPGWKELSEEEKKRESAELTRLLYVALTRARDHLIVSTHTQAWRENDAGKRIPDTEGTRLKPLAPLLENCISGDTDLVRWVDVRRLDALRRPRQRALLPKTGDARNEIEREYRELRELLRDTPVSGNLQVAGGRKDLPRNEDLTRDERDQEVPSGRAARLGVAFHEAMERLDLQQPGNWPGKIQEMISRHSLDSRSAGKLDDMIRTTVASDLFLRARNAASSGKRLLRELPFIRPLEGHAVEEGKIDLLFEEENGWVLVDYKTDWVSANEEDAEEHFRQKYAGQIREYVDALRALPVSISAAYLLLARTGAAVQVF